MTTADVVIRSEIVDLLPAGQLDNESEWSLSTQFGFSPGENAHWTEAIVADGHLSFTHERPQNVETDIAWSSYSPTESNLSIGEPDGGYSWSKGPEIELTTFNMWGSTNDPLMNASLLVSFAIPQTLQDDEVRIELEWDGNIQLLYKFAHTQQAIDNMQSNPLELSLDGVTNWTWDQLQNLVVTVDYVSVGGVDDSEVQVDAVGIKYVHQTQWSGLDSAKAVHVTPMTMMPFHDFPLTSGAQNNLVTTSCGLEPVGGNPGGWVTESLNLPHDQSWGRIHLFGNASYSLEIQSSSDGANWADGVSYNDQMLLSGGDFVRVDLVIFDGCVSGLRIDFNDPTLSVSGEITGETNGLAPEYSYLSIAIGSNLITTHTISSGTFDLVMPVGRYLPSSGDDLEVGLGARFYWSSNGVQETVVAEIESLTLSGGFLVEWDLDPNCQRPADVSLEEDGSGKIIPFRIDCTDDITPTDNLNVVATSSNLSKLIASVDDGRLVFSQQSEQSGLVPVEISVTDERGNLWTSTMDVTINPVDDAPTFNPFPNEILVPVGQPVTFNINLEDVDTDLADVMVLSDTSWVSLNEYRQLEFNPLSPGTYDVSISITDGTSVITQEITVLATSDPDLVIEQVDFDSESMIAGEIVEITVWVRNSGQSAASLVSVRCYDDQTLIDSGNISYISVDGLAKIECSWQLPTTPGTSSLRVYVDPTHDILETSEDNNEYSSSFEILEPASKNDGAQTDGDSSVPMSTTTIWLIVSIVTIGAIIALQMGPGKVRRNS